MITTVECPSCQRALRVPDTLLGQLVKCPTCSHTFTAPDSVEETPVARRQAPEPPPREKDAPARGRRRDDRRDDDDDYPRARRRRYEDDDEDYDDRRRSRRRGEEKPGKVQAIAIMTLIGGILATLTGVTYLLVGLSTCFCLAWPGTYYSLVLGIMAIIRGSALLGDRAHRQPPPQGIAIMQIVNIVNGDIPNLVMGILTLTFLSDREVKDFFRG
jgi:predicted Zn finger-like uncharacterized protein